MTEVDVKAEAQETCMICKHGLEDPRDIHEARTAFSKTLLAVKLGKIIQSPLRKDDELMVYSICSSCSDLVNEIDQCEIKLMALENEVKLKYKMPFPIEVHSRSSQEQAKRPEQQPQSQQVVVEESAAQLLGAEQICQVLDAAGVGAGESYSIEVVDGEADLAKSGDAPFSEPLGESIILYEQPDGDYGDPQLVQLDHLPYRVQLSEHAQTTDMATLIERRPRKKLRRRRWGTEGGYFCDECDATFVSFTELTEHRDTHEAAETFSCRYCKHVARTKIRLHRHMQEHHKDCMLPCPYCEKRFPEKCNLTRHVAIHLDPKFVCEVCSRPFHSKGDLGKHMVFRHTTERNHPCPECDSCFKTSWMMKRHLSRVHARL